jgi:hypothetical protein
MNKIIGLVLFVSVLFFACDGSDNSVIKAKQSFHVEQAKQEFDVAKIFDSQTLDTVLTNMVTYIYRRPAVATNETRTNPEFREYYAKNASLFSFEYLFTDEDNTYYYYLIRPARSLEGNIRGVGGKFTLNPEDLSLTTFEETFNTYISSRDTLLKWGYELMKSMIADKAHEEMLIEDSRVEWPDNRLKYHLERREWRYVD